MNLVCFGCGVSFGGTTCTEPGAVYCLTCSASRNPKFEELRAAAKLVIEDYIPTQENARDEKLLQNLRKLVYR
jgi:hypothetical protein